MARRNKIVRSNRVVNRGWSGFKSFDTTLAGNASALIATLVLDNPGIDETHIRTVGLLTIRSDQVAADESQNGAIGMIVVSDTAAAAGVTSLPSPMSNIDSDGWLLHVPYLQHLNAGDDTGLVPNFSTQYHFDTKAKRIIQDGYAIAMIIQNDSATGIVFSLIMRTLTMVRGT